MYLARGNASAAMASRAVGATSFLRSNATGLSLANRRTFTSSPRVLSEPVPQPANGNGQSRWRKFARRVGQFTIFSTVAATGAIIYYTQKDKHPGPQLPFDETKKTLVVLGSGWGASSLLKKLDTEDYNVIVISPRNYFLFTPLLPSVAVGTISPRSIIQPTRYITRHKNRVVSVIEAEASSVDPVAKTVTLEDTSEIRGAVTSRTINYDYLVFAVGAENQTFGIPGIKEYACFMKELPDAEKLQRQFMDCVETAAFPGQSQEEIDRLLHVIVVGGGPTGVEVAGELHDFLEDDLRSWYPELAGRVRLTLVEALPSVLPMFSKQLIDYTESTFKQSKIDILTKTKVKEVKETKCVMEMPNGSVQEVPYGVLVWAGGNKARKVSNDLMANFPEDQKNKRGITIDDHLTLKGSQGEIFAIGDCTASLYAPTAQVASQQGAYLARVLKQMAKRDKLQEELNSLKAQISANGEGDGRKEDLDRLQRQLEKSSTIRPFHYSHQGSLAYIGSEKAIADLPFFNGNLATGGVATYLFWRSAYISTLFSLRSRILVANDWIKVKLFGRDVSRE